MQAYEEPISDPSLLLKVQVCWYIFKSSTWGAETGRSLGIIGQPGYQRVNSRFKRNSASENSVWRARRRCLTASDLFIRVHMHAHECEHVHTLFTSARKDLSGLQSQNLGRWTVITLKNSKNEAL